MITGLKLEVFFLISQNHLIKFGVIFKLKQSCISSKLLSVLSDLLKDREQRITLNGQVSSSAGVNAGVPQGSILGSLLFLVYINDLADDPLSNGKLFSDDDSMQRWMQRCFHFWHIHDVDSSANELNNDLYQTNN